MSDVSRREFIGALGAAAGGMLAAGEALADPTGPDPQDPPIPSPRDVQVNVKQVMAGLLHSGQWQGSCRWTTPIPADRERVMVRQRLDGVMKRHRRNLTADARLMDPTYIEYWEDFHIDERELRKVDADAADVDLYIVSSNNTAALPAAVIARRLKKPTVIVDGGADSVDVAGALCGEGLESYLCIDYRDLNRLIRLLKTRKALQQTRVLMVFDGPLPPMGVQSCFPDLKLMERRFGVKTTQLGLKEFAREMDRVRTDEKLEQQAAEMADRLIRGAEKSWIDRKYVIASCQFYRAVQNLMRQHGCNAFTIECFQLCSSQLPEKWKVTPCLIHTLLKDQCIASACECDLNALVTMRLLMSLSDRAAFMGNLSYEDEQTIGIWHSVPGMKMDGFDKPELNYQLGHFTPGGWGTKVQICYASAAEKALTIARVDKRGARLGVGVGEVVGTRNYEEGKTVGCTLRALVKVPDARRFFRNQGAYGNHMTAAYGDHLDDLRELGKVVGLDVEVTS